jgi:hypothetical protein
MGMPAVSSVKSAREQAILVFSKPAHISRTDSSEPYASLPWGAIDTLFSAFVVDVLNHASQVAGTDVIFYRNAGEPLDEFLYPLRDKVVFADLPGGTFAEQVRYAVEKAFADGYGRMIVVLDNHPTLPAKMFERIFAQLAYEEECVVVGPSREGKNFLIGLKAEYEGLFDTAGADPINRPNVLLERLCRLDALLFVTEQRYMIDSGYHIAKLREEVVLPDGAPSAAARTQEVFRILDKKYRIRFSPR